MANKKNQGLDKDALKQPDEFLALNTKFMTWVVQHKFLVIAIIVVILLIGGGFSGMKYNAYTKELKAAELTSHAMQTYLAEMEAGNEDTFTKTDTIFAEVFDKYGKTKNVAYTYVVRGNIAYQAKQYEQALSSYQNALSGYTQDPVITSNLQNSIAYTYWAMGDHNQALTNFRKVADNPSAAQQDDALFNIGLIYQEMNSTQESAKAFNELMAKYPESLQAQLLKNRPVAN